MNKKYIIIVILFLLYYTIGNVYAYQNVKKEIVDLRTKYQKIFDIGDSENEMLFYQSPIHYWNGSEYQEIDNELYLNNNNYSTVNSNYNISFPKYSSDSNNFNLSYMSSYNLDVKFSLDCQESFAIKPFDEVLVKNSKNDVEYKNTKNITNYIQYQNNEHMTFKNDSLGFQFIYNTQMTNKTTLSFDMNIGDLELVESETDFLLVNSYGMEIYKFIIFETTNEYKLDYYINYTKEQDSTNITVSFIQDEVTSIDDLSVTGVFQYRMNLSYPNIRDKYIVKNTLISVDNNRLYAGIDPLGIPIGDIVYRDEYISYMELSLPSLTPYGVTSASLYFKKSTNSPIYIHNPTLILSQIMDDEYDNVNGFSTYDESFIAYGENGDNDYTFDVTQNVKEQLEIGNKLLLSLKGIPSSSNDSGKASIYSANVNDNNSPVFSITYSTLYNDNPYGNATTYQYLDDSNTNCFGYALDINDEIELDENYGNGFWDDEHYKVTFINVLEFKLLLEGYIGRVLGSRLDGINPTERRIAFRIQIHQNGGMFDFHFMKEHNNGLWSHKPGILPTTLFTSQLNPDMDQIWNNYNSSTLYFAISEWGHVS